MEIVVVTPTATNVDLEGDGCIVQKSHRADKRSLVGAGGRRPGGFGVTYIVRTARQTQFHGHG